MKQNENTKLIKELHSLLLSNKKFDESALQKIGIDTSLKYQEFQNVKIINDFWKGVSIDLIDNSKDVNGFPIANNKKRSMQIPGASGTLLRVSGPVPL